jgi:hypothetical protein
MSQRQASNAILLLIGYTGLARASAIVRTLEHYRFAPNTVRNALADARRQPIKTQLIEAYTVHGKPATYHDHSSAPPTKLYVLTQLGAMRFRELTGIDPAESEIHWAVRRGGNVDHGLGIVEMGEAIAKMETEIRWRVDWEPQIRYLSDADAHLHPTQRRRVEPDLLLTDVIDVPLEYEVDGKSNRAGLAKWVKACQAYGSCRIVVPTYKRLNKMLMELNRLQDVDRGGVEIIILVYALEELKRGVFDSERFTLR